MNCNFMNTEYGDLPSFLERAKLIELCIEKSGVQVGPFGSQLHKEDYVKEGTPIITVEHLGNNYIIHDNTPYVSDADRERLNKFVMREGDIIFSRVGSVDRRAIVTKKEDGWLFSGRCLRVRVDKTKICPSFLSYFFGLESFKNYIRGIAVGATMPSINTKILSDIPIYFPPIENQKKIGKLLSLIDQKIHINNLINSKLEKISQTIFQSWFVDFDPVVAKKLALEKGLTPVGAERAAMAIISGVCGPSDFAENFKAMDKKLSEKLFKMSKEKQEELAHTASLFPSEFQDNELPKKYKFLPIYDLIKVIGGGTPKRSEAAYWNGEIPWFSVKDVPSNGITVFDTEEHITELGLKKSSTRIQKVGSTIISARGTVGKLALVMKEMAMNQSCYGVEPIDGIGPVFNYFNLSQVVETLKRNAHGAVFDTITHDTFKTCKVYFGGFELAKKYESITGKMIEKIYFNQKENKVLENLRDTLLPKLLAGEIDLSKIEIED